MYKYIFIVFLLLTSTILTAQEITGNVISENGEGVPFANIFLREKNIGIVSDINGHYRLPMDILENASDTLIFSSIGYDTQRFPVVLFAEMVAAGNTDIVLTANYVLLSEVMVTPRTPQDFGLFHLSRRFGSSFRFQSSKRIMVFVENTSNVPKIIQTINIRLTNQNNYGFEKIRVFFYLKNENGFQNVNVGEDIFITDFSQTRIRHDVSELHIPFPIEGIFIGTEIVGEENVMQERLQPLSASFSATTRARGTRVYIFDEESESWKYMREGFAEQIEEVPRMFRNMVLNMVVNMAPQIGITAH
jgi:hypothetical protein